MEIPDIIKELNNDPLYSSLNLSKTYSEIVGREVEIDECNVPVSDVTVPLSNECVDEKDPNIEIDKNIEALNDIIKNYANNKIDIPKDIVDKSIKNLSPKGLDKAINDLTNKNFDDLIDPNIDFPNKVCFEEFVGNISNLNELTLSKISKNQDDWSKMETYMTSFYVSYVKMFLTYYVLLYVKKYIGSEINDIKKELEKLKESKDLRSINLKRKLDSELADFESKYDGLNIDIDTFENANLKSTISKTFKTFVDDIIINMKSDYTNATVVRNDDLIRTIKTDTLETIYYVETITKSFESGISNLLSSISNRLHYISKFEYGINNRILSSGNVYDVISKYSIEPTQDEARDPEFINKKFDKFNNLFNSSNKNIDKSLNGLEQDMKSYCLILSMRNEDISGISKTFESSKTEFKKNYDSLIKIFEDSDISSITDDIKNQILQLSVCGEKISIEDDNIPDVGEDLDWKTFSKHPDLSDITKQKYWKKYTKLLNINALLPIHWHIGLILPTPIPTRVPLPIIFVHIITLRFGPLLIVIWLTINGLVVCPVIFIIKYLPIGDATSVWFLTFRGFNIKIKDKTGCESKGMTIINGIDVSPLLSKLLPFLKDDLPTYERLSIRNPMFMFFLNTKLLKMRGYMGLP